MVPIGITPVIRPYISQDETFFEFHLFQDDDQAIRALQREFVDGIIIDRRLYPGTYPDTWREVVLIDGLTLVKFKEEAVIRYDDLAHVRINTYVEDEGVEEILKELLPDPDVVFFHGDINRTSSFALANDEPMLIKWSDFDKMEFKLLIPVDENHRRIQKFRTPVLYYDNLTDEELAVLRRIIKKPSYL